MADTARFAGRVALLTGGASGIGLASARRMVAEGGRVVSLGSRLGPEFDDRPDVMFAEDRFHPSTEGYAAAAQALLPEVIAAWRLGGEGEILPAVAGADDSAD